MEQKKTNIQWKTMEKTHRLKYEIADELGLLDRVLENGWKSLSSKETGRIGGLVTKRKKEELQKSHKCSANVQK